MIGEPQLWLFLADRMNKIKDTVGTKLGDVSIFANNKGTHMPYLEIAILSQRWWDFWGFWSGNFYFKKKITLATHGICVEEVSGEWMEGSPDNLGESWSLKPGNMKEIGYSIEYSR